MQRIHLLTFDEFRTPRDVMMRLVDELEGVHDWLAFLPSAIVVVSAHTANELAVALNVRRAGMSFIVTEIDPFKSDGQLPLAVWDFISRAARWETIPAGDNLDMVGR